MAKKHSSSNRSIYRDIQRLLWIGIVSLVFVGYANAATDEISFAGKYQAVNPESGDVSEPLLLVVPYEKGMEDQKNLTEKQLSMRAWVVENLKTKEKFFLDRLGEQDNELSQGLAANGWSCAASSRLMLCGGESGVQPFDGEDFTSQTGWLLIILHQGPIELVKCESDDCQAEPEDQNVQSNDDNTL
ncbi:hypothetical protein SOASR032_05490 [Pragia fontium]|uniref:Uncharacterized protein n=1 Tax=Pragia fontium TaxID=82985 RepID=A0ABQ5LEE1_9GAMM|nr:hypothetical protein [Pragia fontium]GKX61980.1 hypothetical protein SOASR032_05490 [Pragia fontium]